MELNAAEHASQSTSGTSSSVNPSYHLGDVTSRKNRFESFDVTDLFSEHDRNDLMKVFHDDDDDEEEEIAAAHRKTTPPLQTSSNPRPIPTSTAETAGAAPNVTSAPSSYGSSGSAFMTSVLNATASSSAHPLSHTPPYYHPPPNKPALKRPRSGSVSGRLRSASEYLEERGLLDPNTKGIIKDLIIIGDEELQFALDNYEDYNNPAYLEQMIQNGALQNRLPQDLDLLGDLDLDFLTMDDSATHQHVDILQQQQHPDDEGGGDMADTYHDHDREDEEEGSYDQEEEEDDDDGDEEDDYHRDLAPTIVEGAHQLQLLHQGPLSHKQLPNKVSPLYNEHTDDGIGELEFGSGDFVNSRASPVEMSDHDHRMRSNSLFSALLNDTSTASGQSRYSTRQRSAEKKEAMHREKAASTLLATELPYGQWLDRGLDGCSIATANSSVKGNNRRKSTGGGGIEIRKPKPKSVTNVAASATSNSKLTPASRRKSVPTPVVSGLTMLLEADAKKREKEALKEQKKKERLEKKEKKQSEKKKEEDEEKYQHVPGSGRPRSLSDPLLHFSLDADGMQQCERPDGWIGAYSPSSRAVRIARFLEKRTQRVWTKSVKYDVRKNFADSRLRVKGRFVKKEEESLMRELMSLT
jgi:CCT motif